MTLDTWTVIMRSLSSVACFTAYACLGATNHPTLALPFAIAGWFLSRGGRSSCPGKGTAAGKGTGG